MKSWLLPACVVNCWLFANCVIKYWLWLCMAVCHDIPSKLLVSVPKSWLCCRAVSWSFSFAACLCNEGLALLHVFWLWLCMAVCHDILSKLLVSVPKSWLCCKAVSWSTHYMTHVCVLKFFNAVACHWVPSMLHACVMTCWLCCMLCHNVLALLHDSFSTLNRETVYSYVQYVRQSWKA